MSVHDAALNGDLLPSQNHASIIFGIIGTQKLYENNWYNNFFGGGE